MDLVLSTLAQTELFATVDRDEPEGRGFLGVLGSGIGSTQ